MKRKRSLGLFSGLALGIVSIYALTLYFGLSWEDLKGFMFSTALLLAAMIIVAAVLVGIIKLIGKLLAKSRDDAHADSDSDTDHE
ncbi:MAG: hypothetical protein V4628_15265 [Pseudomonadota bacterium]